MGMGKRDYSRSAGSSFAPRSSLANRTQCDGNAIGKMYSTVGLRKQHERDGVYPDWCYTPEELKQIKKDKRLELIAQAVKRRK